MRIRCVPRTIMHGRLFVLLVMAASGYVGVSVDAAVTVIGTQYQQDNPLTEFQCIWHDGNYPTSCGNTVTGSNVHVFLKNTGTSAVTISDVILAGHSLKTVLKRSSTYHDANSIYFYWDNPPSDILNAGEPVWYRATPKTIPAGGVGRVVVRLRHVPTATPVNMGVVHTQGTTTASIPVSASAPQVSNVSFSADRTKVYMHWRRSGGAAPTTIKMDDIDVTASCNTVGDSSYNYAVTELSLGSALPQGSWHVYQGIFADGSKATACLKTWSHDFVYATWYTFDIPDGNTNAAKAWIDTCIDRGFNCVENQMSGGISDFFKTSAGRAYATSKGYGVIKWNKDTNGDTVMWFLDDEPDAEEDLLECGTGLKLPCGSGHDTGVLVMKNLEVADTMLATDPIPPTTVNMNATLKPDNFYSYGQAVDVLSSDPYYQARLYDAKYRNSKIGPLYTKSRDYIYGFSTGTRCAAEPNPHYMILYSCTKDTGTNYWPYPTRESKRQEFYYALAGGAKGISYWWFKKPDGLGAQTPEALQLWYEMGLLGNEAKTISAQIVNSHPVSMPITGTSGVWAKAAASGTDAVILYAVNDNYYNDFTGCHYTPINNATLTATLPSWMLYPTPTAFEVTPSGLVNVDTQLNGNQLQVSLGTLQINRTIVVTTNALLRGLVQQRYDEKVRPGICTFAPTLCPGPTAPQIVQHPSNQVVTEGGSTFFAVAASGTTPLSYQWQKNNANIVNGGHYDGAATASLTVSSVDSNDVAGYRCVVTNSVGSATSDAASLTLGLPTAPTITQHPSSQTIGLGSTAQLIVVAAGTSPLTYQWQKNLANLSNGGHYAGATTATLNISSADSNDAGSYRCVVANGYGTTTSNAATITVASCVIPVLVNGNFETSTAGNPPFGWTTYIESSKSGAWTIQSVSPPQGTLWQQTQIFNAGSYGGVRQNVTSLFGGSVYTIAGTYRTNSVSATASVRYSLTGSTDRANSTILASTVSTDWGTFSGTVTATGASLMLFLDHANGTSTNKASAFDNITVTGCGVSPAPTIAQHPASQNICPGANTSFTVSATGTGTLTYLWQKNGANLADGGHYSGATTTTLAITEADYNDVAEYRCVVSNAGGSATSNHAELTLKPTVAADLDDDCDVDIEDFSIFAACVSGPDVPLAAGCENSDFDYDDDVDQSDFGTLQRCYSGGNTAIDPDCAN